MKLKTLILLTISTSIYAHCYAQEEAFTTPKISKQPFFNTNGSITYPKGTYPSHGTEFESAEYRAGFCAGQGGKDVTNEFTHTVSGNSAGGVLCEITNSSEQSLEIKKKLSDPLVFDEHTNLILTPFAHNPTAGVSATIIPAVEAEVNEIINAGGKISYHKLGFQWILTSAYSEEMNCNHTISDLLYVDQAPRTFTMFAACQVREPRPYSYNLFACSGAYGYIEEYCAKDQSVVIGKE